MGMEEGGGGGRGEEEEWPRSLAATLRTRCVDVRAAAVWPAYACAAVLCVRVSSRFLEVCWCM